MIFPHLLEPLAVFCDFLELYGFDIQGSRGVEVMVLWRIEHIEHMPVTWLRDLAQPRMWNEYNVLFCITPVPVLDGDQRSGGGLNSARTLKLFSRQATSEVVPYIREIGFFYIPPGDQYLRLRAEQRSAGEANMLRRQFIETIQDGNCPFLEPGDEDKPFRLKDFAHFMTGVRS